MNSIIDEQIDEDIREIFENLNIKIEENGEISFKALEVLKAYIKFNGSFVNEKILMHIFAYNYIYFMQMGYDSIKELEEDTLPELKLRIKENPNFLNRILTIYLEILSHPNRYEMVTFNYDIADNLRISNYYACEKIELINDRLRNYLNELYFIYSSFDTLNINDIILYIIKTGDDPFNVYKKYFSSKNEALSYKSIIIEMLYLNTYSYLLKTKKSSKLDKFFKDMLKDIENRLKTNKLHELPDNNAYAEFMIEAYFYSDFNFMHSSKEEAISSIKKQTRSRVHSFLLYSIDD